MLHARLSPLCITVDGACTDAVVGGGNPRVADGGWRPRRPRSGRYFASYTSAAGVGHGVPVPSAGACSISDRVTAAQCRFPDGYVLGLVEPGLAVVRQVDESSGDQEPGVTAGGGNDTNNRMAHVVWRPEGPHCELWRFLASHRPSQMRGVVVPDGTVQFRSRNGADPGSPVRAVLHPVVPGTNYPARHRHLGFPGWQAEGSASPVGSPV